jgi:hypothetical protein
MKQGAQNKNTKGCIFFIKGAKCTHSGQSLPRIQGKNVLTWLVIKVVNWTGWELFKFWKWNVQGVHVPLTTSNLMNNKSSPSLGALKAIQARSWILPNFELFDFPNFLVVWKFSLCCKIAKCTCDWVILI